MCHENLCQFVGPLENPLKVFHTGVENLKRFSDMSQGTPTQNRVGLLINQHVDSSLGKGHQLRIGIDMVCCDLVRPVREASMFIVITISNT